MATTAHILVVDDDHLTLKVVEQILQRHGYQVSTAINGAEGLELARELRPDLMILDMMMPVIDGYEVYRRMKSDARTADIAILILSAIAEIDFPARIGSQPVAGGRSGQPYEAKSISINFLSKPIKAKELLARVASLLSH
ncbi:MAG: response regulator [Chloroflexota bacterium]